MVRKLFLALAALAASACTYGSAVDIAPFNARTPKAIAAAGDYCEVQGKTAPFTVVSHEDCMPVTWSQGTRTYTLVDPDDPDESVQAAIVSLGGPLYAASIQTPEAKGDRYQLHVVISTGNAFAVLPALEDDPLKTLAQKQKKLRFEPGASGRLYIAEGKPADIKVFLREAAGEALRTLKKENDEISIGVRDKAGAADHPASKEQTKDIETILKAVRSMTPR